MLLTTQQAAERLTLSAASLKKFRTIGVGPPYLRLPSGSIRYEVDDLDRWLAQSAKISPRRRNPTRPCGGSFIGGAK